MPVSRNHLKRTLIVIGALVSVACLINIVGLLMNPPERTWWTVYDETVEPPKLLRVDYNPRDLGFDSLFNQWVRFPADFRLRWTVQSGFMSDGFSVSMSKLSAGPDIPMLVVGVGICLFIPVVMTWLIRVAIRRLPQPRGV